MNKLGKFAPIIVVIVSLGSLYLAFRLNGMKKAHLAKIAELDNSLTQTKAELTKTKGTLKQTQADLTTTKSNLVQTTATLVTTKAALDQKTQEASFTADAIDGRDESVGADQGGFGDGPGTRSRISRTALTDVGITNINNIAELRDRIVSMGEENKVLGKQLTVMHAENEQLKAKSRGIEHHARRITRPRFRRAGQMGFHRDGCWPFAARPAQLGISGVP